MKQIIITLCMLVAAMTVDAQIIKPKSQDNYTIDANGQLVKKERKALIERKSKEPVDPKYLAGAVPTVDGKIVFETVINTELTAKQQYEKLLPYMQAFCKMDNQTKLSNVSIVDEAEYKIGVRCQEIMVFQRTALSLDETKFNYQLIIQCQDDRTIVTMRGLSYIYDEERGGGQFPAEDMISDAEALNKKKDGFTLGGSRKFRTKTIDRKDEIFSMIANALK